MESYVLNSIVDLATINNYTSVLGEYIPIPKNEMVRDHYKNLGFKPDGNLWRLDVTAYKKKSHYINKKQ
jgi:predicted enzyme involved in methoxymalonyl-ACP biosynthesis